MSPQARKHYKEYQHQYWLKNREALNRKKKQRRRANHDHYLEYHRNYWIENKEVLVQKRKQRRLANLEVMRNRERKKMRQYKQTPNGRRVMAVMGWKKLGIPITFEEYERRFQEQNGKCAICGESHPRLSVDHCHKTQMIRGLLCSRCNWGLGAFLDDKTIIAKALDYLQ